MESDKNDPRNHTKRHEELRVRSCNFADRFVSDQQVDVPIYLAR
jgi:hypothetical protein